MNEKEVFVVKGSLTSLLVLMQGFESRPADPQRRPVGRSKVNAAFTFLHHHHAPCVNQLHVPVLCFFHPTHGNLDGSLEGEEKKDKTLQCV